jgi:hypothetical protein
MDSPSVFGAILDRDAGSATSRGRSPTWRSSPRSPRSSEPSARSLDELSHVSGLAGWRRGCLAITDRRCSLFPEETASGIGTWVNRRRQRPRTESVFCRLAHSVALDRALVGQHLHALMAKVIRQDVAVIEAIEATAGYEGSASGIHLTADAGVL